MFKRWPTDEELIEDQMEFLEISDRVVAIAWLDEEEARLVVEIGPKGVGYERWYLLKLTETEITD